MAVFSLLKSQNHKNTPDILGDLNYVSGLPLFGGHFWVHGQIKPNEIFDHTILKERTVENKCRLYNKLWFWLSLILTFNMHLSYLFTSNKSGICRSTLTLLSNESNKNNKQSQRGDVFPADHPTNPWSLSCHEFNVISKPVDITSKFNLVNVFKSYVMFASISFKYIPACYLFKPLS